MIESDERNREAFERNREALEHNAEVHQDLRHFIRDQNRLAWKVHERQLTEYQASMGTLNREIKTSHEHMRRELTAEIRAEGERSRRAWDETTRVTRAILRRLDDAA